MGPGFLVCRTELKFLINNPPLSLYLELKDCFPYIIRIVLNVSAPLSPPGHAYNLPAHLACSLYLLPEFVSHVLDQIFLKLHACISCSELTQVDASLLIQILDNGFNLGEAVEALNII
jgi:hypothetical protein